MKCKFDEVVKSQKSDGTVKSSRCKARKSKGMKRTYLYAAMTEDAAQRRRWTFYEAVNSSFISDSILKSSSDSSASSNKSGLLSSVLLRD